MDVEQAVSETHPCVNCGNIFTGNFCNNCGQEYFDHEDKSFIHLLEEVFHFITHFEGSFWRTLKTVFVSPGLLSKEYCAGARKKYFKPISFFLLMVVFYLVFPVFRGLNMPMKYYPALPVFGNMISEQLSAKEAESHLTGSQFEESFDRISEKASKVCLLLLVVFSAPMLSVLFSRKKLPLYDHTILAIEVNAFYLILFSILLPVVMTAIRYTVPDYRAILTEGNMVNLLVVSFVAYAAITFRRFYGSRWRYTIVAAAIFAVVHLIFVFYVYKFILFEVAIVFA